MVMMEIRDNVIWTKHLHGDPALVKRLNETSAGTMRKFVVDGLVGYWEKMADGKDGRPTNGYRPIGNNNGRWKLLYAAKRGELVPFDCPEG
jgi:hypothetical protein